VTPVTEPDALHRWLARVLTSGTLVAALAVAVGLLLALASREDVAGGGAGLVEVLGRAGPASIVAAGLLALALVPMLELAVAAVAFGRGAEHRYSVIAGVALLLLAAGLAAALVAPLRGG